MDDNGNQEQSQGPAARPRLFESLKAAIQTRHHSRRTGHAYLQWIRRFIIFTGKRHPREPGAAEVTAFLTHLAGDGHSSVETTMIYTHAMNKGGRGVESPLDSIRGNR